MAVGSFQLPVRPWRGADWGCVCFFVLRSRALQKPPAEWVRRKGTAVCQGLAVSLSGPEAVKNKTICTNNEGSHPHLA